MRFTRRSLLGSLGAAGLAVPMRARAETEPATPALDIAPGRRRFGPGGDDAGPHKAVNIAPGSRAPDLAAVADFDFGVGGD